MPNWLPTLDGIVQWLVEGIQVADVGCGHGYSTLMMAEEFPNSRFHGFDTQTASIEAARKHAEAAGGRQTGGVCPSRRDDLFRRQYGLVCFFDVPHDLGDPVDAARHVAKVLAPGGTVMLVEPFAHDHTADNLSATGQLYYAASTRPRHPST